MAYGTRRFNTALTSALHDVIEGQMAEVKKIGRRRTQLLDDFRKKNKYRELKEEAEDGKKVKRQFITLT